MCLGVPGQVVSVNGNIAVVDYFGLKRETNLDVIDEAVEPGDYVMTHVGYAIRKIPKDEIGETLSLYESLLEEAEEDIMAGDVRGELQSLGNAGIPDVVSS